MRCAFIPACTGNVPCTLETFPAQPEIRQAFKLIQIAYDLKWSIAMLRSTFIGSHLCFSHETPCAFVEQNTDSRVSLILFLMISIPNRSAGCIAKRARGSSERTCSARLQTSPKFSPCRDFCRPPAVTGPARVESRAATAAASDSVRSRLSRRLPPPGRAATDSDPRWTQSDSGTRSGPGPGAWIRTGDPAVTIHRPRAGGHGHTVPVRWRVTGNASQAVRVFAAAAVLTRRWRRVTAGDSCR
jgi:hypothetical protein